MSTGKAVLACCVGVMPSGQRAAMKQVLCSADDKLSNSLPTTSHVGRDKARPLWPSANKATRAISRPGSAGRQQQIRRAGLRAIEPPVVIAGHVARYN